MPSFDDATLQDLDSRFATEGVAFHARPLKAAVTLLGPRFSLGVGQNPEVKQITEAYERLFPESRETWPGLGIGLASVADRVRKVTAPVIYGRVRIDFDTVLGFTNHAEFEAWCRGDRVTAARAYYAVADVMDFTYGLDALKSQSADADRFWKMACSNLEDATNILQAGFALASVVQPICLVAELSLKAALIKTGREEMELSRRPFGHDHSALAEALKAAQPHRDDDLVAHIATALPNYIGSRYTAENLVGILEASPATDVQHQHRRKRGPGGHDV